MKMDKFNLEPAATAAPTDRARAVVDGEPLTTDPLPPLPPDSSSSNTVFKYPPDNIDFPCLRDCVKCDDEFYRTFNEHAARERRPLQPATRDMEHTKVTATTTNVAGSASNTEDTDHDCEFCRSVRDECAQFLQPLQSRLASSVSTALAAYGAVEQLNRFYFLWDQYQCNLDKKCCLNKAFLKSAHSQPTSTNEEAAAVPNTQPSDSDTDLPNSLVLLSSILEAAHKAAVPQKQHRERKISILGDNILYSREDGAIRPNPNNAQPLQRQKSFGEGKSKVSKWTKVKAAFKWERADVAALQDTPADLSNEGLGLLPVNHEVARYLRVPSRSYGGGSADSILSSSSGQLFSEAGGTPGTISSSSSMDDVRGGSRRDSAKSDTQCEEQVTDHTDLRRVPPNDVDGNVNVNERPLTKGISNAINSKARRKSRVHADFELLPEETDVLETKTRELRKTKIPPSPLNLDLKQDLDGSVVTNQLKSPKCATQSLNRTRKISSPGNSSVPSSPSRHSDFFTGFESEELSSGDFSEPTTPNCNNFQHKQDEINRRYQMLRTKLDREFEAKQREWEKQKSNPNTCRAITLKTPPKSEEHSPNPIFNTNLSEELLEENLSPDFKKKLHKWRVKKQAPVGEGCQSQQVFVPPLSPNKDTDSKVKIDWNLWKSAGPLQKLDAQCLNHFPDQKNIPEDFMKKLEQWDKIKRGGSSNDSIKRIAKNSDTGSKRVADDVERGAISMNKDKRLEKHKSHDKEKLEKLSKLKSIVADNSAKEIEVKTSVGVMKFEGISRKFTRKLYEWEKARGIGPESSTFALLHPGYCPIDVDHITKDCIKNVENSPTISRSLSLDSIAPSNAFTTNSQRASSLSLNNISDLKDIESMNASGPIISDVFQKYVEPEPEAVMVEVEDHIVETARELVTTNTLLERETPVYKYEEVACNDYCNTRRVQSYESYTNLAPLLSALKHTDEVIGLLKKSSPDIADNVEIRHCVETLTYIRLLYPHSTDNLMKPTVLNAILDVQCELGRLTELIQRAPLDEACCQEIIDERTCEYNEEFMGLRESLEILRSSINSGVNRYPLDILPDINITSEDGLDSSMYAPTTLEATTDDLTCSQVDEQNAPTNTIAGSVVVPNGVVNITAGSGKKKLRLRKVGSRQNSKTESSDSSDEETHGVLETPRRLKRKNFRLKQRSFDEDSRRNDEACDNVVYVLKVKPGEPIEKFENVSLATERSNTKIGDPINEWEKVTLPLRTAAATTTCAESDFSQIANVFVKTKRKVFTTIRTPSTLDGIAVIECDVETSTSQPAPEPDLPDQDKQADSSQSAAQAAVVEKDGAPTISLKRAHLITSVKSLSLNDIRELHDGKESRCHSVGNINIFGRTSERGVRAPLSSDSFSITSKNLNSALRRRYEQGLYRDEKDMASQCVAQQGRVHLFKKNPDKANVRSSKSNRATLKRIGSKLVKTIYGALPEQIRSTDTLQTPYHHTTMFGAGDHKLLELDRFTDPPDSAVEANNKDSTNTHIIISEHAQRLRKAKKDFLAGFQDETHHFKASLPRDKFSSNATTEEPPHCVQSISSSGLCILSDVDGDQNNIPNSMCADVFTTVAPTMSDNSTDAEVGVYDSLPRAVTRSGKLSSKLGLATLASKFRRAKVKKEKDRNETLESANGALSTLCRQTLLADVIAVPQFLSSTGSVPSKKSNDILVKSKSSPQAGTNLDGSNDTGSKRSIATGSRLSSVNENNLNKSQSEQIVVRSQKESGD